MMTKDAHDHQTYGGFLALPERRRLSPTERDAAQCGRRPASFRPTARGPNPKWHGGLKTCN